MAKKEIGLQDYVDMMASLLQEAAQAHPDNFSFELEGQRLTIAIYPVTVSDEGAVTAA
jgi:hypothetical protein